MDHASGEEVQEALKQLEEQRLEDKQKVDSARTKAICRAGYGNLDSLYVERVLRENAKKP